MYDSLDEVPENQIGLVLGTSRYIRKGVENYYFKYRVQAAADLFKSGKIHHIIVSGDNSTKYYDEASEMEDALMELGVPKACITKDYAGLRTLDSVVRCKKIFGQEKITIISQEFHAERAVYIALYNGIDAVGYCAKDVPPSFGRKTMFREIFAKFKAILDVHFLHTQPKFLGEQIRIKSGC